MVKTRSFFILRISYNLLSYTYSTTPPLLREKVIEELNLYVSLVLEQNLSEYRNEIEQNPHFKTIFENNSELKEQWIKGDSICASELIKDMSNIDGWIVEDSEDACDLLLMDTEIEGSCLSIYRDPKTNQCLLAQLLDGKNRAIVIKNQNGKIIGQLLLRILWDKSLQKPVLFQERTYPHQSPRRKDMERLLEAMCLRRAKNLNLPLVSPYKKTKNRYPNPVESLGGHSSFEYIDPLHTKGKNKFVIKESYLIYDPEI